MSIKIKRFMDFHGLRRFIAQSNLLGSATTACPVPVIRRGLRAAISVRMAELGDLLMGGSKREKVRIEVELILKNPPEHQSLILSSFKFPLRANLNMMADADVRLRMMFNIP